jgi:hypothetical protein
MRIEFGVGAVARMPSAATFRNFRALFGLQ